MPRMDREAFIARMRSDLDRMLGLVADAVNHAPDGQIINQSEEKVRDLFADLRQQAFQLALQMRIDAAQAAFSPSDGSNRSETVSQ